MTEGSELQVQYDFAIEFARETLFALSMAAAGLDNLFNQMTTLELQTETGPITSSMTKVRDASAVIHALRETLQQKRANP